MFKIVSTSFFFLLNSFLFSQTGNVYENFKKIYKKFQKELINLRTEEDQESMDLGVEWELLAEEEFWLEEELKAEKD